MTVLIATDEAGYGPRLGPLVIVATAWRLADGHAIASADAKLREPIQVDGVGSFHIDDSKRIFKRPKVAFGDSAAISSIDRITDAVACWVSLPVPSANLSQWLRKIAPHDFDSLVKQPWFESLSVEQALHPPANSDPTNDILIRHWSGGGWQLVGISARIIDTARFNAMLHSVGNKADILSDSTCTMAIGLLNRCYQLKDESAIIQSDRIGGRAYYAGLVQHHCPDHNIQVIAESSQMSSYRLIAQQKKSFPPAFDWSFTVNGDSYPPVAMSSIIAKSTRERLMDLFNRYFQSQTSAFPSLGKKLLPTAGYASDANRFLADISCYRAAVKIDDEILIRKK